MKASKLVQRRITEMVQTVTIINDTNWIHKVWFHCPQLLVSIAVDRAKKRLYLAVITVPCFFTRYIELGDEGIQSDCYILSMAGIAAMSALCFYKL